MVCKIFFLLRIPRFSGKSLDEEKNNYKTIAKCFALQANAKNTQCAETRNNDFFELKYDKQDYLLLLST